VQWRNRTQDARWAFAIETAVQNSKAYCYLLFHTESGFTSAVVATDTYAVRRVHFLPGSEEDLVGGNDLNECCGCHICVG